MSKPLTLALLACLLTTAGCGDGIKRLAVSGTVLSDGKPVPLAELSFVSGGTEPGPPRPQSGGRVEDGKFSLTREWGPIAGPQIARVVLLEAETPVVDAASALPQTAINYREVASARVDVVIPEGGTKDLVIEFQSTDFKKDRAVNGI